MTIPHLMTLPSVTSPRRWYLTGTCLHLSPSSSDLFLVHYHLALWQEETRIHIARTMQKCEKKLRGDSLFVTKRYAKSLNAADFLYRARRVPLIENEDVKFFQLSLFISARAFRDYLYWTGLIDARALVLFHSRFSALATRLINSKSLRFLSRNSTRRLSCILQRSGKLCNARACHEIQ